jgi:LuxR family quorum sensing-dependent transcriptional regulator|tara:strand:- start:3307 stop:4344 length:1038 start_codon:yes stop_codon:yes gene_type:complete
LAEKIGNATVTLTDQSESFGQVLAAHRRGRGLSQLALSLDAEVSTRHISFLETGRSTPTREMIHRLAAVLDLDATNRLAMLKAAGFWEASTKVSNLDTSSNCHTNADLDTVISIEAAGSAEDALEIAAAALARIGLTQFFTGILEDAGSGRRFQISHHQVLRAPIGWMLHYGARNYAAIDPLVRETKARHLPFFWSDLFGSGAIPLPAVRRMLDEATDFRVCNGFVMPVHRADGKVHALSSMAQDLDVRDPSVRATARAVSVALLHRIDELGLPEASVDLTLGQIECDLLSYLFEGHSIDWIADRYRSDRTDILRAVSAVCAKFGTSDSLEAGLRARRIGLLTSN